MILPHPIRCQLHLLKLPPRVLAAFHLHKLPYQSLYPSGGRHHVRLLLTCRCHSAFVLVVSSGQHHQRTAVDTGNNHHHQTTKADLNSMQYQQPIMSHPSLDCLHRLQKSLCMVLILRCHISITLWVTFRPVAARRHAYDGIDCPTCCLSDCLLS